MTSFQIDGQNGQTLMSELGNVDAPLTAAIDQVEKLQGLFHKEASHKSSSEDMLSEEDCSSSQWYMKQEELVDCLYKMKGLMEEAEQESMRLREEKRLLTIHIGESLVTVNTEMDALKQQLNEQDKMLRDLGANPLPYSSHDNSRPNNKSGLSILVAEQTEQIISLQKKLLEYEEENSELRKKVNGSGIPMNDKNCENCSRLRDYAGGLEIKLQKNKDIITNKRTEIKSLKSEKLDLLDQLKQLYGTLEDKEKELRDFILNYEQRMKDSEGTIKALISEKKRVELEKWNLLQKATESSERCITLKAELDNAEENLKKTECELREKDQELVKLSQSYTKDDSTIGFFALFGKQAPKGDTLSETDDTTTSQLLTTREQESIEQNMSSELRRFITKRPEQLTINTQIDDPMLACSTPVPALSDTQYLSLGTPDHANDDSAQREPRTDSAFPYDPANENFILRAERRSASTELPTPDREKITVPVRRASSFKRKDAPHRVHSPKFDKHRRNDSSPTKEGKLDDRNVNGGVVKRQRSVNKRPRTFHPDIFDNVESTAEVASPTTKEVPEPRSPRRKTLSGTLSRMFGRDKDRDDSGSKSPEVEIYDKWQVWDSIQRIPMPLWKARDVIVWLEIECCMPMYSKNCAKNIKSGKIMLQLSDHDLANALGISNLMHRLKLKLALDDFRYPERRNVKLAKLDHTWVSLSWLKDLGLSQYSELFEKNLIDGRMVNTFTKRELEKVFSITKKSHQVSFACALQLLRKMNFDKDALNLRRSTCAERNIDVLVWSNQRLIDWVQSIDLKEYAENLRETGIHGALIAYEETFTIDTLANALRIPIGKGAIYKHLVSEFSPLLKSTRSKVRPEDKLKNGKAKSSGLSRSFSLRWSRRERSKRLTPSRSTGNINGEQRNDDIAENDEKCEKQSSKQATLL